MTRVIIQAARRTRDKKGIMGLYEKQKRQDWHHEAYRDAPSAI